MGSTLLLQIIILQLIFGTLAKRSTELVVEQQRFGAESHKKTLSMRKLEALDLEAKP